MTGTNDHDDRRLAAWLADGPSRATDRMIDQALAHARTHPRRRDPLASYRKDPMSSNRFSAVGRPITLLVAAALLLVAIVAVGTVGGAFNQRPEVVPPVASPSPSASPSASPIPSPSSLSAAFDLIETIGGDATATITDASGRVVGAVSGQPGEGSSVEFGMTKIERSASDANTIKVTWTDFPCAVDYDIRIDASGTAIAITRPDCTSDAIGVDRVVLLTFDGSVDLGTVTATFSAG